MIQLVIIDKTKASDIYHDIKNPRCQDHGLNNDPERKEKVTEKEAISRGYKKCGNCFPEFDLNKTFQ